MSDFFMPKQDEYWNKYQNNNNSNTQSDYWEKQSQRQMEQKQQQLENRQRYGVNVPDEYYDVFNKIISQAPTPEEAQEEAYKIGSAIKYSQMMNMPLEEAYANVDALNEAQFPNLQDQKGRFEALADMWSLGKNNVELGRLGQQLMQAHANNDAELANTLMQKIDAINQENVLMQDNAPRSWVMQALEAGAQSLPFTGVVAGAGIVGNFINMGTGASFLASSYLSAGTEYIDMIANGASPETARIVANISGGIQGLIEADFGITKGIIKGSARLLGKTALKEVGEETAKKGLEEIGRKVFKRFHFGAGKKLLINYLENRGKDALGEGTEEFLQEITSIVGQEVAASLDGYDIPDDDFKSIVKQTTEAFRGGILGALSMGFIPAGINAAADVKEYKLIKDNAELFESEEMFKEVAKDSPVFEGMSDDQKTKTLHEVWQRAQNRKDVEAQQIAEGRDAAEGAEEGPAENEDGTTEAQAVARNEAGRLYTSDDVSTDNDGNVTGGTFVVGDKTKSEANRYGYIKYSQDAEGNITIDSFKMTEGREGLRAEAFDEFAREHPDVKIDWNAIGSEMQDQKQALIDANPNGAKNGLNYYSTTDLDNVAARKRVANEVRKNIHNVKKNADGSYTRTELSNKQVAAAVTLIESAARRMGMGLDEYVNKTFGNQIFGSREEFAEASLAQGEDVNSKAGGMFQGVAQSNWREVGQQVKAVIYAGEHADFSTWAHEMAHVFQNQLDGDLKNEAEAAFNVVGGDWINSTYTFSDGHTLSSAEAFAYGFQDWLETGKAENEQMRNIFQKFAEFIADAYNRLKKHLNFTPEIESVFNKLLDGDDTIMSKALKAAQEQDNEYRASLKRQAEEKQAAKEAEKEQAKQQAKAEREEAAEGTEFTEAAPTAEELLNGIEEAENETKETTEETNAIDNALENTNLTDEQKEQIAETLKDESSTVVEKAEATTEAAESAYDDIDLFQNEGALLSQLIGEPSIRRMMESDFKKEIEENLIDAYRLDAEVKKWRGYTDEQKAGYIKAKTGWEKNPKGEWKYETDDSINTIIGGSETFKGLKNDPDYLKKKLNAETIRLADVLDAPVLYGIVPFLRSVNVEFINDPAALNSDLGQTGIIINTHYLEELDGERGLKGLLAREIQHVLQATESARTVGGLYAQLNEKNAKLNELYRVYREAKKAKIENREYDKDEVLKALNNVKYDKDEIEARNVARRVLLKAWERSAKTMESTEDVKRQKVKLLSQEENPDFIEAVNKAQELLRKNKLRRVLFQDEINTIRKQYENTDQWMKAPNGEDSNLDEKQWLQVRTPSFKKWFGDWEKDPANASKVVDENGEPLVVYHGTDADFTIFDASKSRANMDIQGNFFSPWDIDAQGYGPNVRAFYLNIRNPANSSQGYSALNTYKGQNEAGIKARELLKSKGFDGVNNDNEEYITFEPNQIKSATDNNGNFDADNPNILFQEVYHGSPHNFENFSTENIGTGEGAQAFGWGLYFTNQESIARFYADKLANEPKRISLIAKNEYLKSRKKSLKDVENKEKYEARIIKNINHFKKELKQAQKAGDESEIKFYEGLIDDSYKQLDDKERLSLIESFKKDIANAEQEIKELKASMKNNRNLYTVEIPDEGYIVWDKNISEETVKAVYDGLAKMGEDIKYAPTFDTETTGEDLYGRLSRFFNSDKKASLFLKELGFIGIEYPAHSLSGYTSQDERNYVIFDDTDAKIIDHLFFQTNAELMSEAQDFESWQEFMDYCETFHADDDVSPIPGDADAQWYQTFWETSNGVKTEQEKNEEAVEAKSKKEGMLPTAVDAFFTTMIKSDPQMVDSFLQAVAEIDAIDLDSEEWQQAESAEDAAQREKIEQLKDFIGITLSDYNWQTALKRIQGGHEISEGLRKRLIGEITDSFKARDFRALYSEVMNDPQFAVAEEDSITASLNKKLKKYHDIVKPNDDISRWSPERRKQLAEQLANREIASKIRSGSLKLDDELDAYIKSLNKQIKETQDQYNELEKETKADYQRIADKERRDLLKLHEQLLLARGKLNSRNTEINRKIAKGLKITDKYSRLTQNLNANYDELFRKYNDLRNTITINAEVQAALDRQEQVAGLREDLNAKQKEKNLTAEVKKMRIQLVKRTMRRVPFNRVDYENAKTIIAIQRMLEPNLLGGVNRFIGIDSPYLRGVISQIVTDSDYKEKILNYLSKNSKASQAFADFKKKLTELKSIKDFDSWTARDRKNAIKYLPKENWVRDLNLLQLAKEREESIDLDIGMEEYSKPVFDEKTGEPKTYKDQEGNEHNVTETAFRLQYDDELGRLVQDAVGADMFNKIVSMPFSEWTTEDLETLAQRIDEIYTEGRDLKAAKDEARKREAAAIRKRIEDAIKETGITINDDDTPEEKERKQKQIEKILGMSDDLKGTEAAKPKGFKAKITRLLHSYADMNVMRFARMLDGQSEGENYRMLYRIEDDCYNKKQRSMNSRAEKVYKVMQENGITEGDLAQTVKALNTEFTVDELLYFLAADKDYAEDEKKVQKGEIGIDANDDYAATSRNAVMFGNMMSDMVSQDEKESWLQLDKDMEEALQNDTLTQEQKEQLATGQLDKKPGTTRYIGACHAKWEAVLAVANNYLSMHPELNALMDVIEADYAEQYGRMNEVSINEFNMPVHRVKAYVPLVRRESNGDTNENQVKEDLLGAAGVGKQWADRGMTQRRVQISPLNQKPVQTGLFRTWADSIERTEHFIAYAPYVRQLNAVYKSRDASYTRRFIESRYGAGAIKYLDEYINEVANPNAGRIRERGAEWLHVLRGKTAPAYLGWKASAIIKQGLTSPWPYMQFVNPAEYFSAAMKFTFNPQMREAIKEKSVFMKMRRMDPVNDLIDEMADNAKTKLDREWSNFSKLGMQGLELIDWACVAPGWLACYEKKYNQLQNASNARYEAKMAELKERNMYAEVGTSEYLTPQQMEAEARKELAEDIEAEAVRYADDCTRACQPSNRVTDLAPLFKNSSEAMKAFLQFQTSLNVIWQNIRYDMPYAVKNKEFTRIAGTVIGYVCAGIFMNSVMEGISGDDDDDETQALRNLIYYSTTQFTDSIPIMGSEITNTMDQLITGKRGFYGSGTDMTPSATKLLSVLTTAKKGNWEKAASLTAEGLGLFLGAPVSGAKEINKLLGKPLSEGDINFKRGITDVYGIAGDILEE